MRRIWSAGRSHPETWTQQSATVVRCWPAHGVGTGVGGVLLEGCRTNADTMTGSSRSDSVMNFLLMLSRTAASLSAGFIGTTSFAVEIVVGLNFCLDVRHCLHLVGQLRGIHEVRIDVREIHHRQIEPGEFVDRESLALFLFALPQGLPSWGRPCSCRMRESLLSKQQ